MDQYLEPLSDQWQISLFALVIVMGAMIWRAHNQVSKLSAMSKAMNTEIQRLARAVDEIAGLASNTEHTLVANLAEYRMAMGNTSAYRDYLQKLGVAPAGDVEPILEAISDGAMAVGRDGKILYVNRVLAASAGISAGISLSEFVDRFSVRAFSGERLAVDELPVSRALRGDTVNGVLLRLRPAGSTHDVILSINGCPARDVLGRVVAAIVVARQVSEEIAMAIEVRRRGDEERGDHAPDGPDGLKPVSVTA